MVDALQDEISFQDRDGIGVIIAVTSSSFYLTGVERANVRS